MKIIIDKTLYITLNPRLPKAAKGSLSDPLKSRGLVKNHLAAFGSLGFVVI